MSQIIGQPNILAEVVSSFSEFEKSIFDQRDSAVHTVRRNALTSFERIGFPGTRHEEYKYTPISKALEKNFNFNPVEAKTSIDKEILSKIFLDGLESNRLVFINGFYSKDFSSIISPENEMTISEFSEAERNNAELLEKQFGKYASYENDAFTAINTAFSRHGAVINVPPKTLVKAPVSLYFINDSSFNQGSVVQPRNLFYIGAGSEVNFIESFHSPDSSPTFVNIVSEIILEKDARVKYTKINNESDQAYHVGNTQVYQSQNSTFTSNIISFGGALTRNNLNIVIDGEGAEANMYGLYLLNGKQHVDNHTIVDHRKPNTTSNELYKGILDGRATGVFNGKIFVRQIAQKTNAFQSNRNILLSNDASINTKPQLEIWADDVKCSHGATTGQLDNEQLFYLRSRGLSEEIARSMLLYAFATDVFENIKLKSLKDFLDKIITDRLRKDF
ncbi:Fe-S cluster assembly protein SufD [soil metagenome]